MIHVNQHAQRYGIPTAALFQARSKNPKVKRARQDLARALVNDLGLTLVEAGAVMGSPPSTISKIIKFG